VSGYVLHNSSKANSGLDDLFLESWGRRSKVADDTRKWVLKRCKVLLQIMMTPLICPWDAENDADAAYILQLMTKLLLKHLVRVYLVLNSELDVFTSVDSVSLG
jgi:hypothetical protein